ncbi:PAS domain-containing protein [Xinfangfangia sp. D13-10-4-6]|uniref:PAS domain-containing protein n=1 Tax=Pseudogemmobacter hezensis TaxID=2737662 RepID=UPI00155176B3|nr:PAS domain-containing protein [Pseudogemmobacter hezensis]NPD15829.1 PAS domain-containing protein [Pseudogemmobacter hezensis]
MAQDFLNLGLARRSASEEARFMSLQRVRGYWEGLIGPGGELPGPAALDPRGLLPALEDVFLAERVGKGLLRLRIAGRRVSAPAGVDMQGLPLSALFLPEARAALAETIERVCNHKSLVTMELSAEGSIARQSLYARLLLLPLSPPDRGVPAVLGCLSTLGEVGRTPRRFQVVSVIEERLGQRIAAASGPATRPVDLPDFATSATQTGPFIRPSRPLKTPGFQSAGLQSAEDQPGGAQAGDPARPTSAPHREEFAVRSAPAPADARQNVSEHSHTRPHPQPQPHTPAHTQPQAHTQASGDAASLDGAPTEPGTAEPGTAEKSARPHLRLVHSSD